MKLDLDQQEIFFLDLILSRALDNYDLFETTDEENEETFDEVFHRSIETILKRIDKLRGNE